MASSEPDQNGRQRTLSALRRGAALQRILDARAPMRGLRPRLFFRGSRRRPGVLCDLLCLRSRRLLRGLARLRLCAADLGSSHDKPAGASDFLHFAATAVEGLACRKPVYLQGRGRPFHGPEGPRPARNHSSEMSRGQFRIAAFRRCWRDDPGPAGPGGRSRSKSASPSCSSSRWTAYVTADCARLSLRAAPEKLPASTMASMICN